MLGYLVLNEDITLQNIISTILVLSGLVLVLQPWREENNTRSDQQGGNISMQSNESHFTNITESPHNLSISSLNQTLFEKTSVIISNTSANLSDISAVTWDSMDKQMVPVIVGYILALCGGMGNAANTAVLKKFSSHIPADVITFYICLGGCLLSTLFMFIFEVPKWPNNLEDTIWLLVHSASMGASQLLGSWSKLLMPQILYYITTTNVIIFSLIGQYTLLRDVNPGYKNIEELSGAVLVIFGIALPVVPLIITKNHSDRNKMDPTEEGAEYMQLLKEEKQ